MVLRGWLAAGLDSDTSLPVLGLVVGLETQAMCWWNARVFRSGLPLLSLALAALAPSLVWYADTIRAYGFGVLLILWVMGSVWRVAEKPSAARIALAGAATMLAVHCRYYNAVHLFVIGGGAALTRFLHFTHRQLLLSLGAYIFGFAVQRTLHVRSAASSPLTKWGLRRTSLASPNAVRRSPYGR